MNLADPTETEHLVTQRPYCEMHQRSLSPGAEEPPFQERPHLQMSWRCQPAALQQKQRHRSFLKIHYFVRRSAWTKREGGNTEHSLEKSLSHFPSPNDCQDFQGMSWQLLEPVQPGTQDAASESRGSWDSWRAEASIVHPAWEFTTEAARVSFRNSHPTVRKR